MWKDWLQGNWSGGNSFHYSPSFLFTFSLMSLQGEIRTYIAESYATIRGNFHILFYKNTLMSSTLYEPLKMPLLTMSQYQVWPFLENRLFRCRSYSKYPIKIWGLVSLQVTVGASYKFWNTKASWIFPDHVTKSFILTIQVVTELRRLHHIVLRVFILLLLPKTLQVARSVQKKDKRFVFHWYICQY